MPTTSVAARRRAALRGRLRRHDLDDGDRRRASRRDGRAGRLQRRRPRTPRDGPGGTPRASSTCPALEEVDLPANGLITIDLTDEAAVDRQLDRALDDAGVRRALAAPRAGAPGPESGRGRCPAVGLSGPRRSSPWPSSWPPSPSPRARAPPARRRADPAGRRACRPSSTAPTSPARRRRGWSPCSRRRRATRAPTWSPRRPCWRATTWPSSRSSTARHATLHGRYRDRRRAVVVVADARRRRPRAASSARSPPPTCGPPSPPRRRPTVHA